MTRDASIPIALWACAAIVVHAVGSGGVVGVTVVQEKVARERASIRHMVNEVRDEFDVVYADLEKPGERDKPDEEPTAENPVLDLLSPLADLILEPLSLAEPPKPKEPEAKKEEAKKEEEKKEEEKPDPEEEKKQKDPKRPELLMLKDKRIAIRQATEKDEPDNPNAPRLAEKARTVEEETVARIRSSDTVSKNPSPGSNQRGPTNEEGNSEKTKQAQAEEAPGDPKRAPGEKAEGSRDNRHTAPKPPVLASTDRSGGPGKPGSASPGGVGKAQPLQPSPAIPGSVGGASPASPEIVAGNGEYSEEVPEAAPGGVGVGSVPGVTRPPVPGSLTSVIPKVPSLGASGAAGKISLSWQGFVNAVSEEQLEKERAAAGQKVRSEHRGRYDTNKFERFLPDIENYDPSVKIGNQTALNAAQSAFATYLSTIHNAIHPIFADEFLALLNGLPKGHELNESLVTHVEIILSKDEGKVLRRGVTKQSGSTVFDAAALDAIDRASPFGAAPDAIVSADGNVYLHWEFHRDPVDACSTRNAHPFIVKDPKPIKTVPTVPKRPKARAPKKEGEPAPTKTRPNPPPAADKPGPRRRP